ncbi:MAG: alanine--tRNA ligase [Planctomycetota bacterium]
MYRTAAQVRQEFIDFFVQRHAHTFVPSSPVVPHDDPTLLFANAGMNQFKDVFLGTGERDYTRAANSQKCIRAGGKHNDLEDVGKDSYHHTFFEMLGNWSFGDYFKAEAIRWSWELLTNVWGLDKKRLYATVFAGDRSDGLEADTEAEQMWLDMTDIEPSHISRWDKRDNFWEMGDTGPCGPCSEIHYDLTDDLSGSPLVNTGNEKVIEIWNLVFIQFNRATGGKLSPLPARHIDTGMGLERVVRVLQGKSSNYDIDLWEPIFEAIRERTDARPYAGGMDDPVDIAYRVIADHIRCLTIALTDGAVPGNEGRGYVLRRILRRAVRHVRQTLGQSGPVLHRLVDPVVMTMGDAFPELKRNPDRVRELIFDEEESFGRTLDRGLALFDHAAADAIGRAVAIKHGWDFSGAEIVEKTGEGSAAGAQTARGDASEGHGLGRDFALGFVDDGKQMKTLRVPDNVRHFVRTELDRPPVVSGEDAFKLHDTYGFPIDLTEVLAEERGLRVDLEAYKKRMDEARETARAAGGKGKAGTDLILSGDEVARLKHLNIKPTKDVDKFHGRPISARIRAIWNGKDFDDHTPPVGTHDVVGIVTNQTNFYAEMGGQVADEGRIIREGKGEFHVEDTQMFGGYVLHIGRVTSGRLAVGDTVEMKVDLHRRMPVMQHHTGTHLLNLALRKVLGGHVDQKGSLVAPDRLRFDFSHTHAVNSDELSSITDHVNDQIAMKADVIAAEMPLDEAKKINGLRAVFGERYPDPVRVVSIGVIPNRLNEQPDNERWADYSIELCGGTHVGNTADLHAFVITHEEAVAKGVRRVIALTGDLAKKAMDEAAQLDQRISQLKSVPDERLAIEVAELVEEVDEAVLPLTEKQRLRDRISTFNAKVKELRKVESEAGRAAVVEQAREIAARASGEVIVAQLESANPESLRSAMDVFRDKHSGSAIMLLSPDQEEGKVAIMCRVPEPLVKKGLRAGDWARETAKACGGGGGGRPDMAQAGGKDPTRVPEAIDAARAFAIEKLGK